MIAAFVAASVGRWNAWPTQAAAVPDPAVLESVNVCADQFAIDPVVDGVPAFAPDTKFHETAAVEVTVVAAAESSVSVFPSKSSGPENGVMSEVPLFNILLNSLFRSEAVRISPATQVFSLLSAMISSYQL